MCLFGFTPLVMPQGSQTIMQSPHRELAYLFMHKCGPHLSGTPQVHSAAHAFMLVLFPARNAPHSKFSHLIHSSATSSDSMQPFQAEAPIHRLGSTARCAKAIEVIIWSQNTWFLSGGWCFRLSFTYFLGAYLAWYFPLHNRRVVRAVDEVKVAELLDEWRPMWEKKGLLKFLF